MRELWEGSDRVRFLVGPRAVPPETAAAFGATRHRTVPVHERHFLGADGLPTRHETRQVIEATQDGLDRYPYRFDTDALTVEVGRGYSGLVGPLYHVDAGVYAVDIALEKPLRQAQTTTLEYTTTFHYRSAPNPEFRRAARERIDGVNILRATRSRLNRGRGGRLLLAVMTPAEARSDFTRAPNAARVQPMAGRARPRVCHEWPVDQARKTRSSTEGRSHRVRGTEVPRTCRSYRRPVADALDAHFDRRHQDHRATS